jgi:glycosyltransferase involved in cell wall biosynthesis
MRVLVVNDYRERGGAEVVAAAGAQALRARGHEVEMFTGDGVGLRRTPFSYIDSGPARRSLRRAIARFHPDVVHLHNIYHLLSPGVLATVAHWKRDGRGVAVMTAHDAHLVCPNAGLRRFTRMGPVPIDPAGPPSLPDLLLTRWDHRGPAHSLLKGLQHLWNYRLLGRLGAIDAIITPSRWGERLLTPLGRPVRVVPNPIEVPGSTRPPRPAGPLTLVFVGRVEPEKGLPEFVLMLRGVEGVRLEVVGEGEDIGRSRAAAVAAGVEMHFHGRLARTAAIERIAASDALVLPSLCAENAPMVLFEAIAAGTPVLVSDRGGAGEIVEEFGVGRVFDPLDAASARAAVDWARTTAIDGEAWARAREALQGRSPARHAERLERVYAEFACASCS